MASYIQDLGALGTPLMYCFRSRERILDLFEMLCGARITVSYMRPGGVFFDAPPEDFWPALEQFLTGLRGRVPGAGATACVENEIIMVRTTRRQLPCRLDIAINGSVSGPVLRASGLAWDWRKVEPYDAYDLVEFDVPVAADYGRQLRPFLGAPPGNSPERTN